MTANGWCGPGWRLYEAHPRYGKAVRDWIAHAITAYGSPADLTTAALAVSELFSNAVLHGPQDGRVLVGYCLWSGGARIVVCDGGGATTPRAREPADGEEGGRGLQLIEALSAQWGSFRTVGTQIVWCDLGERLPAAHSNVWEGLLGLIVGIQRSCHLRSGDLVIRTPKRK